MEDNKITNISYAVAPSNSRMFEMKIFVDVNKEYLTKMNPCNLLGQEIIIRYILAHV